jgi:hypothetical protein
MNRKQRRASKVTKTIMTSIAINQETGEVYWFGNDAPQEHWRGPFNTEAEAVQDIERTLGALFGGCAKIDGLLQ